jgi:hypothetical protein
MGRRHLIIGLVLIVIGLIGLTATYCYYSKYFHRRKIVPISRRQRGKAGEGKLIYYTGRNAKGKRIPFSLPGAFPGGSGRMPHMRTRMGIGCVNCHGRLGKGGTVFPDDVKSKGIRWKTLSKEGFDIKKFKRAVTKGIDEDGETLSPFMPRWNMTDSELKALRLYLKTLP